MVIDTESSRRLTIKEVLSHQRAVLSGFCDQLMYEQQSSDAIINSKAHIDIYWSKQ